jgi:SAM-dependent methyltransferase
MSDSDYRLSHLDRGDTYDRYLAETPIDSYMHEMESRIVRRAVPALFDGPIPRYLDFACGTGRMTSVFEPMAETAFGIDVSESMVSQARGKCPRTQFRIHDITQSPPDIAPVDLVSSFRFFGNANDDLRVAVLDALNRLLLPGGYLVVNDHRNPQAIHHLLYRLTGGTETVDLSYFKMRRLLRAAGFAIQRSYGIGWWIVRSGLARQEMLDSALGRFLEPVSRLPFLAPICTDMVIVARKVR